MTDPFIEKVAAMTNQRSIFHRLVRRMGFLLTASVIMMVGSILILSVLYYWVEGDQGRGFGWFDWLYFAVITTRTIGFGDITVQTTAGKVITIINALLPASLFFGVSVVVLQDFFRWLEEVYRRYKMQSLKRHHIIVADEELTESIVQEYSLERRPFVCVGQTPFDQLQPRLQEALDINSYVVGDPTRDEVLESVGIRRAEAIVIATPDDNVNLYVLVTAKGLVPDIKTIVRINRLETESKFRSVGADVLLPAGTMLGRMLSQAAVSPVALDLLVRLQTGTAEPFLHEVKPQPTDKGKPIREAVGAAVALFRDGQYYFDLEGMVLQETDVVLRIGG